jgi:4-amino-4-deoxy-L-arabinose transferase-like glycosyltransferase
MSPDGSLCAYFPPVYPTIIAACILTGHAKSAIILAGSLIGAGTVWCVFLIGRRLFGATTALLASVYAAVYPYFIWHDAVLQETATLTLVVAVAILLLLRAHDTPSRWNWLAAGAVLGVAVLTKANLALFVPFALLWIVVSAPAVMPRRLAPALWATLGVALVLGPWVIRTWRITGAPILYSNAGFSLWTSNHRLTFDYFPRRSIDDAAQPEFDDLKPEERREFDAIADTQGIRQTRWLWARGVAFIRSHPRLTLERALYKVWIAFSPRFSPAQGWLFQSVYFIFWLPVLVLSLIGAWKTRRRWRELGYIYMLVLSFALTCAIFWGHTSHRMYIEPYLMILAAASLAHGGLLTVPGTGTSARASDSGAANKESSTTAAGRSSASLRRADA